RKLPEIGHQPGVRIRADAFTVNLLTEAVELLLAQPALEKGARVETGRGVALEIHQVATVLMIRALEEMIEADVVERRRRGKAGDMPAQLAAAPRGAYHHGHGVPADDRADPPLHGAVAGHGRLAV